MNKLILSLSLVAALAAPAMAQSAYDQSAGSIAEGNNSGTMQIDPSDQSAYPGVDTTTTNSITRNDPVNNPMPQRGDQGEYFGANGR